MVRFLTGPFVGFVAYGSADRRILVRLFMIQHDCSHGAFFLLRRTNDWVGRVLGVFTLTPYDFWRCNHAIHHATSGNLARRGIGDVDKLTVSEYRARSRLGAAEIPTLPPSSGHVRDWPYLSFFLQHRLPVGLMSRGWQPWVSTMATNTAIALIVGLPIWLIGAKAFVLVYLPGLLLAASIGVWLFYVQHQFEAMAWHDGESWRLHEAALHGSSHYDLPTVLRWITANIGIHHVHHLCSRIPYRLPQVLRDYPELVPIGRLTLCESRRCVRLALWDEGQHRLVSFRDARAAWEALGRIKMQSDSEIGERAVNCGASWTGPKSSGFHFP